LIGLREIDPVHFCAEPYQFRGQLPAGGGYLWISVDVRIENHVSTPASPLKTAEIADHAFFISTRAVWARGLADRTLERPDTAESNGQKTRKRAVSNANR
jgi:hypothetical protein